MYLQSGQFGKRREHGVGQLGYHVVTHISEMDNNMHSRLAK